MQPLLHIGYHKTGSTTLSRHVFSDVSAGFLVPSSGRPRRLHATFVAVNPFAFDPGGARNTFEGGIAEASERGLVPVFSHERLSGNPHSGGYDARVIADRLAAVFPDARVLVVIREQRSMLTSLYKQYVKRGGAGSLANYVGVPPARGPIPSFRFDFLEYHRLVGYYRDLFGAGNVLVLPYELLAARPQAFQARIGEVLGVPAANAKLRQENVSPSAVALSVKRHANRYVVRDALNPTPPLPIAGSNGALLAACDWADARLPGAVREAGERRLRRRIERELGDRYARSNVLTSEYAGVDLGAYGYICS